MTEQLIAFALVSLAVIVIPGPDLVLLFKNAAKDGRIGAVYTAGGIMLGNAVLATAAAVGLTALLMTSQTLFDVVRIAGGLYLIYLGSRAVFSYIQLRRAGDNPDVVEFRLKPGKVHRPKLTGFRQGLITNLLNPKVAAFYLSLFPQFDLSPLAPGVQHLVLAAGFWVMALVWYILVVIFLTKLQRFFQSRKVARRTEAAAGAGLLGLGTYVLVSDR
ncbi:LysE family translocator [Nesterenkonia alkaliphila]|uniref:LysE family transporter n=1 Tax=Nesterenkonia alkaliphila TaxID=1463631 RepID=A0A7K1UFL2_9MICC|nr:LysE family translocator [Nesterenkonia alkaliphila]MVT25258.1 LysE family transporter [Nesterenkonia alkaliphila]GFZ91503.1 lysine transporter LysE [Nesterenkonia alkaliphila]